MHKYMWQVQYIWRRWKPLASKKSENFEWAPHGMPMFRAQITVPTSALSMTKSQEKVGLCKLIPTPPHHIPISKVFPMWEGLHSSSKDFLSSLCSRGSCLRPQAPQSNWLHELSYDQLWNFSGSVLVWFGKDSKILSRISKYYCGSGNTKTVTLTADILDA